jgi:hypothetical protein
VTDPEEVDLKKTDQIVVTVSDRAGKTFEPDMEESGAPKKKMNLGKLKYFLRMALPVNSVLGIFGLTSSSSVSFSNFRFFGTLGNVESAPILYVFTSLET